MGMRAIHCRQCACWGQGSGAENPPRCRCSGTALVRGKAHRRGKGIKILGAEFTDGDRAKTKSIVSDYIARYGQIDAVWMDAGATTTAAIEAFEDAGKKYPVVNGEDQQDFLQKWKSANLKAIAPTCPTYQWRTAIIAALHVLKGEPVPGPIWDLPDPAITQADLDKYVNPKLPPLHYAMCGCENMPGYPQRWAASERRIAPARDWAD